MKLRRKLIIILTILSIVITVVNLAIYFIFPLYLQSVIKKNIGANSGMNIIGGADGPTSIVLSGSGNTYILIFFALLSLLGIIYLVITKQHNSGNKR